MVEEAVAPMVEILYVRCRRLEAAPHADVIDGGEECAHDGPGQVHHSAIGKSFSPSASIVRHFFPTSLKILCTSSASSAQRKTNPTYLVSPGSILMNILCTLSSALILLHCSIVKISQL